MRSSRSVAVLLAHLAILAARAAADAKPLDVVPHDVLASMGEAADRLRDYTMTLVRQERMGDTLGPERTTIEKWARPYRIYLKDVAGPDAGQEVLFAEGWNGGRLRAHRGRFPDLTFNLDPRGYFAMAHAHHPVTDVSLPGFVKTVLGNVAEAERRGEGTIRFGGRDTLWGRPTLRLELDSPRAGDAYVLKRGETLWDVADATGRSMYAILYANRDKGWRGPRDPDPGDTVFVPRYYAGRMLLWVDEELRLPIRAEILDHDGRLYERYEHRDLKVDVGLTDADFDPANPEYDF